MQITCGTTSRERLPLHSRNMRARHSSQVSPIGSSANVELQLIVIGGGQECDIRVGGARAQLAMPGM